MKFEPGRFPISWNPLSLGPTLPIYIVFTIYAFPNLVTLFSSFNLFIWTLELFHYGLLHHLCSLIYNFSKPLDLFSHRTILFWSFWTFGSLSYVFNFSCPRVSANLKPVCKLPHRALSVCFIIKQTPHLNKSIPKIFTWNKIFLQFPFFCQ